MSSNVIAIDIGAFNLKIVLGKQHGNNVVVEKTLMIRTPNHSYSDGKILDTDLLANELSRALNTQKIKGSKVYFTVESTSIIMRELNLPVVKQEEMHSMIMFEIEQYLPIVLSEYVIEYRIQNEYMDDGIKKCKISVAALPRSISEGFLQLAKALKLQPTVLDMNANSIAKLFDAKTQVNSMDLLQEETIALVDFGHNYIHFIIASKGHALFSRLIHSGGNDINTEIANTFNLDLQQSDEKKIKDCDLLSENSHYSMDQVMNDTVRSTVNNWISEIQRLLQYYTSRGNEYRVHRIYILGGSSFLKGLPEYMQDSFNIPIQRLENISSIKLGKNIGNFELNYYLNAIGAIIRK